jgi:hypothetical protein
MRVRARAFAKKPICLPPRLLKADSMSMGGWRVAECWRFEKYRGINWDAITAEERGKIIDAISVNGPFAPGSLSKVEPMPLLHELGLCIFFCGLFGAFLYVPMGFLLCLVFAPSYLLYLLLVVAFLALIPAPYTPSLNHTFIAEWFVRYSSYRCVYQGELPTEPTFGLVPPHGVFPLQNLMMHFMMPKLLGRYCRGMAADALLRMPIIRHFIAGMGGVSATKDIAIQNLKDGFITGVSPDGIAGIFEVNNPDEVLLMLRRRGVFEIAIRSGEWVGSKCSASANNVVDPCIV